MFTFVVVSIAYLHSVRTSDDHPVPSAVKMFFRIQQTGEPPSLGNAPVVHKKKSCFFIHRVQSSCTAFVFLLRPLQVHMSGNYEYEVHPKSIRYGDQMN